MAKGIYECPIPADEDGPDRIGYMAGPDDGKSSLYVTPQKAFEALWKKIKGEESWNSNPLIWVVQFEKAT